MKKSCINKTSKKNKKNKLNKKSSWKLKKTVFSDILQAMY